MKKTIVLLLAVFLFSGCVPQVGRQAVWSQQDRQDWQKLWRDFNENHQRQLDRQYYGQPRILHVPQQNRSNFFQERYYEQKLREDRQRRFFYPNNP